MRSPLICIYSTSRTVSAAILETAVFSRVARLRLLWNGFCCHGGCLCGCSLTSRFLLLPSGLPATPLNCFSDGSLKLSLYVGANYLAARLHVRAAPIPRDATDRTPSSLYPRPHRRAGPSGWRPSR